MLAARRSLRLANRLGVAAQAPVCLQARAYQGGLSDKDRIFTNLYNDGSQFLDGAKKRVCMPASLCVCTSVCLWAARADILLTVLSPPRPRGLRAIGSRPRRLCSWAQSASLLT